MLATGKKDEFNVKILLSKAKRSILSFHCERIIHLNRCLVAVMEYKIWKMGLKELELRHKTREGKCFQKQKITFWGHYIFPRVLFLSLSPFCTFSVFQIPNLIYSFYSRNAFWMESGTNIECICNKSKSLTWQKYI